MKILTIAAALGILLLSSTFATASTDNIRSLARMTMSLDQPLSEADKASLDAIVDSDEATDEEATIALALSHFDKTVRAGDAARLYEVIDDDLSDDTAKILAGILLRVNQNPDPDDANTLARLAQEPLTSVDSD